MDFTLREKDRNSLGGGVTSLGRQVDGLAEKDVYEPMTDAIAYFLQDA